MFHAIYSSNPDSLEVTSLEYPSNSSSVAGMIGEPKDVSHMLQSFCLCKTKTIASRHCWSLFAEVRSFALSGCLHGRNAKSRHAICRIVFRQERGRLQEDSREWGSKSSCRETCATKWSFLVSGKGCTKCYSACLRQMTRWDRQERWGRVLRFRAAPCTRTESKTSHFFLRSSMSLMVPLWARNFLPMVLAKAMHCQSRIFLRYKDNSLVWGSR